MGFHSTNPHILIVFGTRPEFIKMLPLIREFRRRSIPHSVCNTSQHEEMLDIIMTEFGIIPDYDFGIMTNNQSLSDIASSVLTKLDILISNIKPNMVLVQGDTSTSFVSSLASFYHKIKIGHIEAGLRTNDKHSPFPEEINRRLTSILADFHFAPTRLARRNLLKNGIDKSTIFVTGNTVIDTLFLVLNLLESDLSKIDEAILRIVNDTPHDRLVLITAHRRESFGPPLISICESIKRLSSIFTDCIFIYPVHLNPNIKNLVYSMLHGIRNVYLIDPIDYFTFVYLMNRSYLILTDSGGIQEEAPSLGKPILILREKTERPEGIEAGVSKLVGLDQEKIVSEASLLLNNRFEYQKMAVKKNPYGDGKSAERIVDIIMPRLGL